MAPRPHPVVLASLVLGCVFVVALLMPRGAAGAGWRWPLRGPVVGAFHLSPRAPFARGQRRGIDVSAPRGAVVRAACAGRVSYAGPVPRRGLAVSVRCGALVATYLGLGRLAVRAGSRLAAGQALGTLGSAGRLRLGARRTADRRAYLNPLTLLADERPAPPPLGPAPRPVRPRAAGPARPAAQPRAFVPAPAGAARRLPWPAYPALALVAAGLPVGGLMRCRRRGRAPLAHRARAAPYASRAPG
jgi:murein DD-endopeptidase MepM/ murein hydrolase activator NlpD